MLIGQHEAEIIGRNDVEIELVDDGLAAKIVFADNNEEIVTVAGILGKSAEEVAEAIVASAKKAYGESEKACSQACFE